MIVLFLFFAYLVGSIPTGFFVAHCKGISNIRLHGSGNVGATNVGRHLGSWCFLFTFLGDIGKAYLFLCFCTYLHCSMVALLWASIFLLVGNHYSIFLKFHGGKGIATAIGILLFWSWPLLFLSFLIWLMIFLFFKTVWIASIGMVLSLPLSCWTISDNVLLIWLSSFVSGWCFFTHLPNLNKFLHQRRAKK